MRFVLAILLLGACGVRLDTQPEVVADAAHGSDASPPADAAVVPDAPVDARPCEGGDVSGTGPGGECFVQFQAPATYPEAQAACAAIDAHLAYLVDAATDTFAEQLVGTFDTFVGGNDLAAEGAFVWDDGTPFSFTNWHDGEPNNGNGGGYQEDCVIIAGARTGKQWDDRPCDTTQHADAGAYAYLCEY